jgi:D-alanyl-lipoteichoic acid acyltransferase DltB (MBOAT superfamily)
MNFNSLEFIYAFLPLSLVGYFLCGRNRRMIPALAWLVLVSLIYYGWDHPHHVLIILASCLVNYWVGLKLGELGHRGRPPSAKALLALAVSANLGLLAYYKYTLFFLQNVNYLVGSQLSLPNFLWPLGISFFTFQQVAYLVDIHRGGQPESSLLNYVLEVSFYPKLLAGPIVRHRELGPQLRQSQITQPNHQHLAEGLALFVVGLFKKAVMADGLAPYVSHVFDAAAKGQIPNFGRSWLAVLAYTLQIYYDFSGYSDMAIGISRMMGIILPFNFDSPYKSRSIAEFWRRWHITLSFFLRDYLYIPLGGNRRGQARRYLNLIVTMLLGGLWHGAGWTFVIWGGLHGLFLAINQAWRRLLDQLMPRRRQGTAMGAWAGRLLTFLVVAMAWIFFRAADLKSALLVFRGMLAQGDIHLPTELPTYLLALGWRLAVTWFMPNSQEFVLGFPDTNKEPMAPLQNPEPWWRWRPSPTHLAFILILGFLALGKLATGRVKEFLYYQF